MMERLRPSRHSTWADVPFAAAAGELQIDVLGQVLAAGHRDGGVAAPALVKELGKMTPYLRYKGALRKESRRKSALATVYQKHRTLPTRKRTYRV